MKLFLKVSFVGTHYCGYQIQPNGITVQRCLNACTERLFGFPCDIVGCSRTDSGVHANEFCVTVAKKGENSLETTVPLDKIPVALSCFLPEDIVVLSAMWVAEDFHPRYDVVGKEYVYRIWNHPMRNPFFLERAWHYPRVLGDEEISAANEAAQFWKGTHDFASYMASGSKITDTTRTVYDVSFSRETDGMLCFRITANGFLYHMVRILVGTLMEVASGRLSAEELVNITEAKDRRLAGPTAPACGLYLNRVIYENIGRKE